MRLAVAILAAALCGCGYHVGGKADLLPKSIKTIAITSFGNATTRYRLAERLPGDIGREFISRTRYRIVADPREADAVLSGTVVNFMAFPTIFDPSSGRATGVGVSVNLHLTLTDRATGAVIFSRNGVEFKERYEISVDPNVYFDESTAALERLSRDVARSVVSAILERF